LPIRSTVGFSGYHFPRPCPASIIFFFPPTGEAHLFLCEIQSSPQERFPALGLGGTTVFSAHGTTRLRLPFPSQAFLTLSPPLCRCFSFLTVAPLAPSAADVRDPFTFFFLSHPDPLKNIQSPRLETFPPGFLDCPFGLRLRAPRSCRVRPRLRS